MTQNALACMKNVVKKQRLECLQQVRKRQSSTVDPALNPLLHGDDDRIKFGAAFTSGIARG